MSWKKKSVLSAACIAAFGMTVVGNANAADHTDPPAAVANGNSADIGDFYAWHSADTLSVVVTFAGPAAAVAAPEGTYDRDILYGIHIDSDGDNEPDSEILVRFGQDGDGNWGIQAAGIPGEEVPVSGAVESMLDGSGAQVWAGVAEDPFFFDLQGFGDTLQTGTLMFDMTRDSFAGANITAIVIDIPLADALNGGSSLSLWATTSRI